MTEKQRAYNRIASLEAEKKSLEKSYRYLQNKCESQRAEIAKLKYQAGQRNAYYHGELATLSEKVERLMRDIIHTCDILTTGNVAHHRIGIKEDAEEVLALLKGGEETVTYYCSNCEKKVSSYLKDGREVHYYNDGTNRIFDGDTPVMMCCPFCQSEKPFSINRKRRERRKMEKQYIRNSNRLVDCRWVRHLSHPSNKS